jgi:hypothetical protein
MALKFGIGLVIYLELLLWYFDWTSHHLIKIQYSKTPIFQRMAPSLFPGKKRDKAFSARPIR